MQAIQGVIEQKKAAVSKLLEEIETLEKAQGLLGNTNEPAKRRGRPKGSKNKSTAVKTRGRKATKKAGGKRGRPRKVAAAA